MTAPDRMLDHLVDALGRGDEEEALGCFVPGATVVLSGDHHDYSLHDPVEVVAPLLRCFMELSWAPRDRHVEGGAHVEDGLLTATHIGEFLGVRPAGERVTAQLRLRLVRAPDGRLETLTVWGSRDAVAATLRAATTLEPEEP